MVEVGQGLFELGDVGVDQGEHGLAGLGAAVVVGKFVLPLSAEPAEVAVDRA